MNKAREGEKKDQSMFLRKMNIQQKYRADLLKRFYVDLNATFNDNQQGIKVSNKNEQCVQGERQLWDVWG